MKRLLSLVILLFCVLAVQAKHLEFMGIPITGSITNFQNKLLEKGCKLDKNTNKLPNGVRGFNGRFAGKDCEIYVYYNTRTKIVYQVRAVTETYYDYSLAQNSFNYFKNLLNKKYEDSALSSDLVDDSTDESYYLAIFEKPVQVGAQMMGTISINIIESENYGYDTYFVAVDYEDLINSEKNDVDVLNDL